METEVCRDCQVQLSTLPEMEARRMTRETAIRWYNVLLKDMRNCDLKTALQMGLDALKAQEPEDFCEACQIHYPEECE